MDFIFWIVVLIALTVLISSFRYWVFWISLCFVRLRRARSRTLAEDEVPGPLRRAAAGIERQLQDLGFVYQAATASFSIINDLPEECLALLYFHPERQTIAVISETPFPASLRPFEVVFYNLLPGGRALQTSDCFIHDMFPMPAEFIGQDGYFADLEQQWQLHCGRLNFNPAAPDDWSPVEFAPGREFLLNWFQQYYECCFDFWLNSRMVWRLGADAYFLNPLYAARFARNWIECQRKAFTAIQENAPVDADTGRYFLERQLGYRRTGNALSKALLLIFSLVAFYLTFGLLLSWSLVPLLVVVLLLHELGHYWAMRYFGYRDTQIFFIPFLGAAATGTKADARLWQEIIVYLAGPVPGIVLGLALTWSPWVETWAWLHEFALLSLVLNIINLLPLAPLDGGRIVEKLLFARYAGARLGFYCVSAMCFAAGAWYTRDFVLAFLVFLTGTMAWNEWRKRPLLAKMRGGPDDDIQEQMEARKKRVLDLLFEEPLTPIQRLGLARELLARIADKPATARVALAGMLVYVTLLGGSLAGAFQAIYPGEGFDDEKYYSVEFWRDAIAADRESGDPGWRTTLSAVQSILSSPRPEDAEEFVVWAQAQVAQWREPDLRLAQWRLLKPELTGVPLVEKDMDYVRDNVLLDQGAAGYERVYVLVQLLDARSLMADKDRLRILEDALLIQQKDPEPDDELAANLYFRKGKLHGKAGEQDLARWSFEEGILFERRSEYPLYQDSNYEALLDLYFAAGNYRGALAMSEARLASLEPGEADQLEGEGDEYRLQTVENVRQQYAWFLLLTDNMAATAAFAVLARDHRPSPDKAGYDKKALELLLDQFYSSRQLGGEEETVRRQLQAFPDAHIQRFIKGCKCQRGAFDTFRHERYLELMREVVEAP